MEVDTTAVLSVVLDDGEGPTGTPLTGAEALFFLFAMAIPLFGAWRIRTRRR